MLGGGGLKWAVGDCGWFEKWQQSSKCHETVWIPMCIYPLGSCKKPCKILHWGYRKDHIGIHTNIMLCHISCAGTCVYAHLCTTLHIAEVVCLKWLYGCKTLPFGFHVKCKYCCHCNANYRYSLKFALFCKGHLTNMGAKAVMASRMWDGLQHDNESTNDSICLGLHHKHTRFMLLICKSITLRTNTLMQQSARIQIRLSNRISRYATWYYLNV
jgi:hypothetical protein